MSMFAKNAAHNYQQVLDKGDADNNKVLQIKQIECEQRLIVERMVHLELQKERLKHLLNVLQSLDSEPDEDDDDQSI